MKRPGVSVQRSLGRWATNSRVDTMPSGELDYQTEDTSELVVAQWVSLCDELAPLIRVLWVTFKTLSQNAQLTIQSYGCTQISVSSLQQLSYQTFGRLSKWLRDLPDSLKIYADRAASHDILLLQ